MAATRSRGPHRAGDLKDSLRFFVRSTRLSSQKLTDFARDAAYSKAINLFFIRGSQGKRQAADTPGSGPPQRSLLNASQTTLRGYPSARRTSSGSSSGLRAPVRAA